MAHYKLKINYTTYSDLYRDARNRIINNHPDNLDVSIFAMREYFYAVLDLLHREGIEIEIDDETIKKRIRDK